MSSSATVKKIIIIISPFVWCKRKHVYYLFTISCVHDLLDEQSWPFMRNDPEVFHHPILTFTTTITTAAATTSSSYILLCYYSWLQTGVETKTLQVYSLLTGLLLLRAKQDLLHFLQSLRTTEIFHFVNFKRK